LKHQLKLYRQREQALEIAEVEGNSMYEALDLEETSDPAEETLHTMDEEDKVELEAVEKTALESNSEETAAEMEKLGPAQIRCGPPRLSVRGRCTSR
jgi:hypothetical protein